MEHRPESITLKINVVVPGKGTIELSDVEVRDLPTFALPTPSGDWFDSRTGHFYGGVAGAFWGCFGGLFGTLGGILVPRGKGRRLLTGMFVFAFVMGILHFAVGIAALFFGQPYHVWYPFVLIGGLMVVIMPRLPAQQCGSNTNKSNFARCKHSMRS